MVLARMKLVGFTCAFVLLSSGAFAQWDPSTEAGTSTTTTVAPTPQAAPPELIEGPPPQPLYAEQDNNPNVGFTWALQIGVPIFLDVPNDIVRPGADLSFFGAADFGYFAIGGAAGIGWTPIDLDQIPPPTMGLAGRSPLTRLFLSIPEIRVQAPDLKVVLPYAGISFDMNFWNFRETEVVCNFYWCSEFSVYRFTPGFTARGGLGFKVKHGIHVDLGLRYSYSGPGNFFRQHRQWLTPYVGVLVRTRN